MRIDAVELRRISLPLVSSFRTATATEHTRHSLLVRVLTAESEGWGECVAEPDPLYSSEYLAGAEDVIVSHLLPRVRHAGATVSASQVAALLGPVRGHRMAKSAIEMAVLDAELRASGQSFASALGAERTSVPVGVSVGIMDSIAALLSAVEGYLSDGYGRVKLKIEPGWDLIPVSEVRRAFGEIALQVDANASYRIDDAAHLRKLDEFDLLMLEQPLPEDDLLGHAELAQTLSTPLCLDESIVSERSTRHALALGACSIVNIKPGRVGGYLEARRIHDLCMERDVAVWCGGMLETGLGRAGNLALAALPGFRYPGDISATNRYFALDITEPFVFEAGELRVPQAPGLGIQVDDAALAHVTTSLRTILG